MLLAATTKTHSKVCNILFGVWTKINTNQRLWFKVPTRFFQHLPFHCVEQGFSRFKMAGRLIEHHPTVIGGFFNQEKASIPLYDGSDSHIGFPNHKGHCNPNFSIPGLD